jgi:flavin reductase (DIM6/NTAB) family NADH-FMN oxidoreductase RutF
LGNWRQTEDGLPFLSDAQANLFCEVARIMDYATHAIFIARVYFVRAQEAVDPLLFQDGKYAIAQVVSDGQGERGANGMSAAAT